MSSFKNAAQAQRRTHRERSQPANRRKFGLLEKHKDYVVRAQNFNKKKKILRQLRGVAEGKNPDEFYRGMIKSKMVGGKHQLHTDNTLSHATVQLLKSQDANYLRLKLQAERSKVSKMESVLHGTRDERKSTHTFFRDSDSEEVELEGVEALPPAPPLDDRTKKTLARQKKAQYRTLMSRKERVKALQVAASKLQVYKNIASAKGRVYKEVNEDSGVTHYRWRKQRSK